MKVNLQKAFTVVEMLVSVAIVSVIMATVLFGYSTFNDNLAIGAAGQEMAIAVRQAQTYGLTVKEVAVGGGDFSRAYGMYFDLNDPTNYYLFADINNDNKYTVGSGCGSGATECIEKFILRNNIKITNICNSGTCPPSGVRVMNINFIRPNPDAAIYFVDGSGGFAAGPPATLTGKVVLTSPKGTTQTVVVESTGQVLVQ